MGAIVYPAGLPRMQLWPGVPRERRAGSAGEGIKAAPRARSRDRIADIDAQWFYKPQHMAAWSAWYEDDLLNGTRWFAINAPGPGGWRQRVCRYRTATVRREALPGGHWRVTAQLEQRGRSLMPETISVTSVWQLGADVVVTPPGVAYPNMWVINESDARFASIDGDNSHSYALGLFAYGVNDITATRGVSTGKRYAEIKPIKTDGFSNVEPLVVGWVRSNTAGVITDRIMQWTETSAERPALISEARTIFLAVDFDSGEAWIQDDGLSPGGLDLGETPTFTGVTGTVSIFISHAGLYPDEEYELRTTEAEFAFPIPAGFDEYAA
jgi:hypothetical protein